MKSAPIPEIFTALHDRFGPQGWWPAETAGEMIIGAILVQNTAWTNVEKAIASLRAADALHWPALHRMTAPRLAALIRPAGYFNVKAARLKSFAAFLDETHGGSVEALLARPAAELRALLLGVKGVGPETADSIVLYAAHQPVFVVDAYTRRILRRHRWAREDASYDDLAALFTRRLPADARLFNEYHALLVRLAKEHCTARVPACAECPLRAWLPPLSRSHAPIRPG